MAIQKEVQTVTYSLREEIASRVLLLTRTIKEDPIRVEFGVTIHPSSIIYKVDAEGNKIGIYKTTLLKEFDVSDAQLMGLFGIQITLGDGTVSYIGEVLSNFADQLIASNLGSTDIITTQHIDISSVVPAVIEPLGPPPPLQE